MISHGIPPLILTVALMLALTALVRVGMVLATLDETELDRLRDEGQLHGAAWGLDVEMRHALIACARGEQAEDIRRTIAHKAAALKERMGDVARVPPSMIEVVNGYLGAANETLEGDACETLHGTAMQMRRGQLDERLTDLWVVRLGELHQAVSRKETEAQRIVSTAAWLGIPLAVASFVLAMWSALQMARLLEEPLASLARAARRVGRGDFDTPAIVRGPPEVLALAEDLDRMRRQLGQLETLKQGFLASVSHELRTPLSKIREGLALLQDGALGELDAKKLRVVQIARTACEREIRMVTTLLDLSRLRAGSPIRLRDGSSLDTVVHAAIEGERAEAQQRGVTVEVLLHGESPIGRLDPPLMERAIANLVRNAIAVSARGQVVTIERVIDVPGEGSVAPPVARVIVRDQGPGVPAEIRENLFDAFVTSPVPNSAKSFGSGIGLALAREVARAHGGDLTLVEGPTQPIIATHAQTAMPAPNPAQVDTAPLGERRGAVFALAIPLEGVVARALPAQRSLGLDSTP